MKPTTEISHDEFVQVMQMLALPRHQIVIYGRQILKPEIQVLLTSKAAQELCKIHSPNLPDGCRELIYWQFFYLDRVANDFVKFHDTERTFEQHLSICLSQAQPKVKAV